MDNENNTSELENKPEELKTTNTHDKDPKASKRDGGKTIASSVFDIAEMFAICAAVVLLVFTFVARLTVVDGESMEKTLHEGEFIMIRSVGYTPQRGDIVVVDDPSKAPFDYPLIKRVIAVGGDEVDIDFDTWTVTVNGEPLTEDYVNRENRKMNTASYSFPITVAKGKVFVMGDNRNHSADSRNEFIKQIDERCVVGKAILRIFPLNKFTVFD